MHNYMVAINRYLAKVVEERLTFSLAVTLLGPRQVGKTTLALKIGETRPSLYFDLESPLDR